MKGKIPPRAVMRRLALILLVPAALALGGCSLIFVDGPPTFHQSMSAFSCEESKAWPIVDGVLAAYWAAGLLVGGAADRELLIMGIASGPGLFGASAWIGNRRVDECRAAYRALVERATRERVIPATPEATARPGPIRR
jgi:hypothetical protein